MVGAYDARPGPCARLVLAAAVSLTLLAGCSASPAAEPASRASATPSPAVASATQSAPATPAAAPRSSSFADVEGTWCLANDATDCFTIALPRIEFAADPDFDQYVFPAVPPTNEPASWAYADLLPDPDGCYRTATDVYPATSGAAFIFCPAGSVPADLIDRMGDTSVDRVFITQEMETTPFYRTSD